MDDHSSRNRASKTTWSRRPSARFNQNRWMPCMHPTSFVPFFPVEPLFVFPSPHPFPYFSANQNPDMYTYPYNNRNGEQGRRESTTAREGERKRKRTTGERPKPHKQAKKETEIGYYYKVLEIDRNASDDDLKKAYHKLAMKWHPDKNLSNTEEAEAMFKQIAEAYDVLRDKEKRAAYDRLGHASAHEQYGEEEVTTSQRSARPSASTSGGYPFFHGDGPAAFWFNPRSAHDIFAEFFGFSRPFSGTGMDGAGHDQFGMFSDDIFCFY